MRYLPSLIALFAVLSIAKAQQSINPADNPGLQKPLPSLQNQDLTHPMAPMRPGADRGAALLQGASGANETGAPTAPPDSLFPQVSSAGHPFVPVIEGAFTPAPLVKSDDKSAVAVGGGEGVPWRIRPIFNFATTFDDNIYITNTNRKSDVIFSINGGLAFELGDYKKLQENYLVAEYQGTGYIFVRHPQQNAYDQNAALLGQYRFSKLSLQVESRYQYLTGPDREVGQFTDRTIISNALRAQYDYSEKTVLDGEFSQLTALYPQFINSYNYQLKGGADYKFTEKTRLGLEGYMGVLDVANAQLQYYQQVRVRGRYELTGKLSLKASAGVELREFEDGHPARVDPVFTVGMEYHPFPDTLVALNAYSNSIGSSSISLQNYVATGVSLQLQQKLFQHFTLSCAIGYENDTYYAVANNVNANRRDNFIFVRPSVNYNFLDWLSAGVFYEYRNNDSTETPSSFYDNRTGCEIGLQF